MIWVGRLILLEYALPLRAYMYLKVPWPAKTTYCDQAQRLTDQIHTKYMQRGCFSPLGYMDERLHHGRMIAAREGRRTNISWSADGELLLIMDYQISMYQFRRTVHDTVAIVQQKTRALMLGWWPEIDLRNFKDSLVKHRPGHSFL